jgi:DMSO/TMAO reductase YedYZ heme-binding membrane subunit
MKHIWWYTARSSGIVALALLGASVLWGLALSTKVLRGKPRPNWILDLHRFLGGLALIFVGIHMIGLYLDSFLKFSITNMLVPTSMTYHPVAAAWGVVAFYLLVAVELTSLARKRLSKKVWRWTHYLSFPLFVLSVVHTLWIGSERHNPLLRWGVIGTVIVVAGLTFERIRKADKHDLLTSPPTGLPGRVARSPRTPTAR